MSDSTTRRPLPKEFTYKGDSFTQVIREDRVAIYRRTSPTGREQFEVIIVQGHDGREVHGTYVPPAEFYPSTSAWGMTGWTLTTLAKASAKMHALCLRFGIRKAGPVRRRTAPPARLQTLQTP